jgi:hypothetical protein
MYKKNMILHMVIWGGTSGALLGMLYALLSAISMSVGTVSSLRGVGIFLIGTPFGMVYGALFGATFGLMLGLANGLLMAPVRYGADFLSLGVRRILCYGINLLLVVAGVRMIIPSYLHMDWFLVGAPSIIALAASLLATERYFAHLTRQHNIARKHRLPR